uniref:Repressor of RNA polymerase III transcription MAF1 n=1 Tax=Meloidogyne enterolobii TaxID=390850 RepID=A0A6V7WAY3_MELEN|nr:unnamed protein product [Meloidogyne enterolobii]
MKLLDNEKLDEIATTISRNAQDLLLDLRLESYSCKMVTSDKKEWKKSIKCPVDGRELQPLSPPEESVLSSSPNLTSVRLRHLSEMSNSGFSDNDTEESGGCGDNVILVEAISKRTLFNILALLNQCYPDYDFSQTKSASFRKVTYQDCIVSVDGKLVATVHNYGLLRDILWRTIEDSIKIDECCIYSYIPQYCGDPFTEDGCIWSFNFFFFNKTLKRFLFFASRALCNERILRQPIHEQVEREVETPPSIFGMQV